MTKTEIANLRNFSKDEGDIFGRKIFEKAYDIENELMTRVDKMIDFAKQEYGSKNGAFIVHDINLGDHITGSLHYKGKAIDGHFRGLNLFHSFLLLVKFNFHGIGLYPQWSKKGFHADIRNSERLATWVQWDAEYKYDWDFFEEQLEIELEC